jgi:hypothetical protein
MIKRSLLVLATLAWVAPLSAHDGGASVRARSAKSDCPKDREKQAARPAAGSTRARAVAPVLGSPTDSWLFSIGRGASVLSP